MSTNDIFNKASDNEIFTKAFEFLIELEGYLANDTGGETIWGISEKSHPDVVATMKKIGKKRSREYAKSFYFDYYWRPLYPCLKIDLTAIRLTPALLRYILDYQVICFIQGVNFGIGRVKGWMRKLSQVDIEKRGNEILWLSAGNYARLGESSKYRPFLAGWINRLLKIRKFLKMSGGDS